MGNLKINFFRLALFLIGTSAPSSYAALSGACGYPVMSGSYGCSGFGSGGPSVWDNTTVCGSYSYRTKCTFTPAGGTAGFLYNTWSRTPGGSTYTSTPYAAGACTYIAHCIASGGSPADGSGGYDQCQACPSGTGGGTGSGSGSGSGTGSGTGTGPGPGPGTTTSGPGPGTTTSGPGTGPGPGGVIITGTSVGTTTTGGGVVLSGGGVSGTGISGTGGTGSGVLTGSGGVIITGGGVTGSGGGGGPTPTPCKNPEEGSPGSCKFIDAHHACDDGVGGGRASPVSSNVTGTTAAAKFDSIINKKLACCLNTQNKPLDPITKFDCIDNSKLPASTDFNSMWSKSDADTGVAGSGGQLFATVLSNAAGKPVTGFFTLDGARCNEFSEFGATGDIQTWKINPTIMAGQQNKATASGGDVTGSIPIPTSSNYSAMKGLIKKGIPSTPAERLRCPLLVRAYIVSKCASDPTGANVMHTAHPFRPSTAPERCSSATGGISAHFRAEQWVEIAGTPKLKTFDTAQDLSAHSISVENILSQKNGTDCDSDTTAVGNLCEYAP